MKLAEFTYKNAIKIRSGIMPVLKKQYRNNLRLYAFRYVNLRNYKEYIFVFNLNFGFTDSTKNPDTIGGWVEDTERSFLNIDDPRFEMFLDKYDNEYGASRFNIDSYHIPDILT